MSRPTTLPPDTLPTDPLLASSCLDFLLIELVPLAQRIADQLHARDAALREEFAKSPLFQKAKQASTTAPKITVTNGSQVGTVASSTAGAGGGGTSIGGVSAGGEAMTAGLDDETKEAVYWRLDGMGYRVGQGLVERFSANRPRPSTPLDAIKFLCKDLWQLLFRKPIDNLKTNHRGIFVLTDNRFHPLSKMSVDRKAGPKAGEDAVARAQAYLMFPSGILRGALAALGVEATVHAETTEMPTATFQIKTKGAKA